MRLVIAIMLAALASGCAVNPYAQRYSAIRLAHAPKPQPATGEPRVVRGTNEGQDSLYMLESGYVPLGYSSAGVGRANERDAIEQAKAVGASVVLIYPNAARSASARPAHSATYWTMGRPSAFGVFVRARDRAGPARSDRGVLVLAVRRGSPADRADVRPGDVIERIGDVALRDNADMRTAMSRYAGQTTAVDVLRDGKTIAKSVTFGSAE